MEGITMVRTHPFFRVRASFFLGIPIASPMEKRIRAPRSGALENFGPWTGTRTIFATGLGRSSLPWENQSWGASRDQRITGRGSRGSERA